MLSMGHFARDIIARLHHSASYFAEEYAERLAADLREIALIDWKNSRDLFTQRKCELLLSHGYDTVAVDSKPFAFSNGVAIIPIHGMLLNRFSGSYSFATGYNFIRSQRMSALGDSDVELIVYDVNSYGGLAAGCGELSKEMFDTRDVKPSLAIVDHACYSAAYFLASAADRLVCTPSSGVGSIGCVSMHVDLSEMLEKEGVKITFFKSGKEKTDGNPYEPLSATAKRTIQSSVDYHATAFIESVARNRNMDESDIRAMEARCFDPPGALENGLIDAVQTPSEAIASFFNDGGVPAMTTATANPNREGNEPATLTMTQDQLNAAIAAGIAAHETARRDRKTAIMALPETEGRSELANHLADSTDLAVDAVKGILSASPKIEPAKPGKSPFHNAMNNTPNPNVGADNAGNGGTGDDGGDGGEPTDAQAAERILGTYSSLTGAQIIPIKKTA